HFYRTVLSGCDLLFHRLDKVSEVRRAFVAFKAASDGYGSRLLFLSAGDQHVGVLLGLSLSDLVTDLFGTQIDLRPDSRLVQSLLHRLSVRLMLFRDRQHLNLHRSQPGGERAREMLDQDADEPLDGAEG